MQINVDFFSYRLNYINELHNSVTVLVKSIPCRVVERIVLQQSLDVANDPKGSYVFVADSAALWFEENIRKLVKFICSKVLKITSEPSDEIK